MDQMEYSTLVFSCRLCNKEIMFVNQPLGPVPLPVHTSLLLDAIPAMHMMITNLFTEIWSLDRELWCLQAQTEENKETLDRSNST